MSFLGGSFLYIYVTKSWELKIMDIYIMPPRSFHNVRFIAVTTNKIVLSYKISARKYS